MVGGVVVIDQCSELCHLVTQSRELGLNRVKAIRRAREFRIMLYPLVLAHRPEYLRMISIQRVSRNVGQQAQSAHGHVLAGIRARRRQGSQGLLEAFSG